MKCLAIARPGTAHLNTAGNEAICRDMARIAMVSYWTPPQMGVASHRILRLTRTLLAAGHQVHWVTLDRELIDRVDKTMVPLIPEEVVRHGLGGPCLITRPSAKGIVEKILRTIVYKLPQWFAVPDGYVEWTMRLRRNLGEIVKRNSIDTVFFCCGPHGSIMMIPKLREQVPDLRIIVDYRDLLSGNFWRASENPRTQGRLLKREKHALASADAMFLNTSEARKRFIEVVQPRDGMPATVMRNAADYDLAEVVVGSNGKATGPFGEGIHLGYFGTIFERRRLTPILETMAKLSPDMLARTHLHCYCDDWSAGLLDEDAKKAGSAVAARIVRHTPVPFGEALRAMRAMDALVLVNGPTAEDRIFVPGKLYDYLMARRPVLFVGEPGDAWRIIADCCGEDWCSRHGDEQERIAVLERLAKQRAPDVEPNPEYAPDHTFQPLLDLLGATQ